jgi:hypothetical protein
MQEYKSGTGIANSDPAVDLTKWLESKYLSSRMRFEENHESSTPQNPSSSALRPETHSGSIAFEGVDKSFAP